MRILNFVVIEPEPETSPEPVVEAGCGSESPLVEPSGVIESPNYPDQYGNNNDCIWVIEAPADQIIHLTFEDFTVNMLNCRYIILAKVNSFFLFAAYL
jgi:hypothetical protein